MPGFNAGIEIQRAWGPIKKEGMAARILKGFAEVMVHFEDGESARTLVPAWEDIVEAAKKAFAHRFKPVVKVEVLELGCESLPSTPRPRDVKFEAIVGDDEQRWSDEEALRMDVQTKVLVHEGFRPNRGRGEYKVPAWKSAGGEDHVQLDVRMVLERDSVKPNEFGSL